ncbi:MAG TPA: SDR family oxidoreductase [Actinopolymorphaceae bacterium]|nr:SDR family oxidoreductase [Actinopolymorphaceae bacterium]
MPTALVTGPTAGLGRAYAETLARRGHDLVLVARDLPRLGTVAEELSDKYSVRCDILAADLADEDALQSVEKRLYEGAPAVDFLVNNAGFGLANNFLGDDTDIEQRALDVMVRAVMRLSKAALPRMVENGSGVVVNLSSIASFAPYGTYGAAKAWVTSFSEGIANELVGTGVRMLAVCPGFVHTEFHDRSGARVQGLPSWMWLQTDDIVKATFAHLDAGRSSPVLVPTLRYKFVATASRHLPRPLIRTFARGLRMRRG